MRHVYDNVLECVGNTPLVRLNALALGLKSNVYVKLEFLNPGGSVKDRIALQIIADAEASGELKPGGTIVEATSGNTGAGLAMVAALRGYKCVFVLPDKQSEEKRASLRAYGAKVVVTPTNVEPDDPRSYYMVSRRIADETENSYYANQYHNPSNPKTHYLSTGPELLDQLDGKLDVFIGGIGTGGTITGTGKYLKEHKPDVKVVGVDPVGSIYYDFFKTGGITEAFSYVLEGIGEDFLPTTMDFQYVDDVVRVNDQECFETTRRLAREEGLFVGGSCGAAVAGALKWLQHHDVEGQNVVILLPDGGAKYLSKIYNDQWMEEQGFLAPSVQLGAVRDILGSLGQSEVLSVPHDASIPEAIGLMRLHGVSQLPVFEDKRVMGILHENRLLDAALKTGRKVGKAGDLADNNYCTVDPETQVSVLTELLRKVRIALVIEEDEVTAVLTHIDVIDHVARISKRGS
jgi:cystathionine beta-synthase